MTLLVVVVVVAVLTTTTLFQHLSTRFNTCQHLSTHFNKFQQISTNFNKFQHDSKVGLYFNTGLIEVLFSILFKFYVKKERHSRFRI